ncbi:MAG: EipA family protein [Hyphomicrobiaceae bacterium]
MIDDATTATRCSCGGAPIGSRRQAPGRARLRIALLAWLLAVGSAAIATRVEAAPAACTRDDFAAAIDAAGASLRDFNGAAVPQIQEKLKQLQSARGWSDAEAEDRAVDYLFDARIGELDAEANALLERLDTLGHVPADKPLDCARLDDLKSTGASLLDVMRKKSVHTMARLDAAIAKPVASSSASASAQPTGKSADLTDVGEVPNPAARPSAPKPAAERSARVPADAGRPPANTAAPPSDAQQSWTSATRTTPAGGRILDTAPGRAPLPPPEPLPPVDVIARGPAEFDNPDGYTIDEIRLATRGFFGTVSTNLASVIEYAFSQFGRPAGYVLGQEGGGAFLAGLRYGKGTVFMRSGASRPIFWHGPSVGYDFGAEGSRTLFLIYNLAQPDDLFRRFAGVDGSAYLVGGVGLTVLKGGPVVMAPIRTGLGLRLGANIGYLRFTPEATWNPF